jgi:deoxyribodipyrimidine photo-lyase
VNVVEEIKGKKILHWFRRDLRPVDHEIITNHGFTAGVTCFYIYEEKYHLEDPLGFSYYSEKRKTFLEETLDDLERALKKFGIELLRFHNLEDFAAYPFDSFDLLTYQEQYGTEEAYQEQSVVNHLGIGALNFNSFTLVDERELPFSLSSLPFTFTAFRKKVEKYGKYQSPLEIMNLAKFSSDPETFKGGYTNGLYRLNYYTFQTQLLSTYKETRNGLLGTNFSSRLSPWLAVGAISPRLIYANIQSYEARFGSNESTYWLVFELLWRDFFQLQLKRFGDSFFHKTGIKHANIPFRQNTKIFWKWAKGETDSDFVNANMKELNASGWMSNRGRQNVASYLIHDLNIDWRWGASYFESKLIDYDVASNWGNWMYIAGTGNDPRPSRKFNTTKQAERYDPDGTYVRKWS